jgi:hypothetical protein
MIRPKIPGKRALRLRRFTPDDLDLFARLNANPT